MKKVALIGDAFLSCGCLSYYGPFTGSYRDDLVTSWVEGVREEGIPSSDGGSGETDGAGFSLIGTLGDPVEIRGWQNWALPTDKVTRAPSVVNLDMHEKGRERPCLNHVVSRSSFFVRLGFTLGASFFFFSFFLFGVCMCVCVYVYSMPRR